MNAVIGMTGLLLRTISMLSSATTLETIRSSGDALLAIINDILDFSKIDGGGCRTGAPALRSGTVLEVSLDLVAAQAAEKGLELLIFH